MEKLALILIIILAFILIFISRVGGADVDYTCPDPLIKQCYDSGGIPITKNCKLIQCLRR